MINEIDNEKSPKSTLNEKQLRMIQAMDFCESNVVDAAISANIDRSTHYGWLKTHPEYKARIDELKPQANDFVRGKLWERINGVFVEHESPNGKKRVYKEPPCFKSISFWLSSRDPEFLQRSRNENINHNIEHTDSNPKGLTAEERGARITELMALLNDERSA